MKAKNSFNKLMLLGLFGLVANSVYAQWTVIDPFNLVYNTLSEIAAVSNEINTATAVVNQMRQIEQIAASLKSVDNLSGLTQVAQEMGLYNQLINTNQQLVGTLNQSQALNNSVISQFGASSGSWEQFINSKSALDQQNAQNLANQYQSITNGLSSIAARRQSIVNQLQASSGETSAMQAVGAGLDTLIGQNQLMLSTLAAKGNADLTTTQTTQAANNAAKANWNNYQQKLINGDSANLSH